MRDEEKAKGQLIKELQKMRGMVAGLEELKLKYNQVDKRLKQSYKKLQKIIEGTANIITKVVETRDTYSTGHQQRVSKLAMAIAQEMKLS
jgi:HD-GYP domain-containing protein (c-di-GMP phosphodiesterase class II)